MNVYPDGGVSRLRVWGKATVEGRRQAVVHRVNTLFDPEVLRAVCASKAWIDGMAASRPFASWEQMIETSNRIWFSLDVKEWLDAFAAHPRIGERKAGWSSQEQSGTQAASEETMGAIAAGNRAYEEKFGFVYLVCATGKSAEEMRENLEQRLQNDRQTELNIAAEEHAKITALRLEKLVL
jgi:allantoicase